MTDLYVVVLKEQGTVFGPFGSEEQAESFALYLRDEVDPAVIRPLCDPAESLLRWREEIANPAITRAMLEVPR